MGRPRCFSSIFFPRLEVCSRLSMGLSLQICFLSPENSSTAPRPSPRQLMEMAPRCGTEKGAGQARKSTSPPGLSTWQVRRRRRAIRERERSLECRRKLRAGVGGGSPRCQSRQSLPTTSFSISATSHWFHAWQEAPSEQTRQHATCLVEEGMAGNTHEMKTLET